MFTGIVICTRTGAGKLVEGDKLFFVDGVVTKWINKDGSNSRYSPPSGLYPTFEAFKHDWMRGSSAEVKIYHMEQSKLMEKYGYVLF